jgi:putative flippase GtrA
MNWRALYASALLRFLVVGGSFSLIYSLTTAALIRFAAAPPFWASIGVYALCIPLAYLSHKHFAFGAQSARKSAFALYTLTQIASLSAVSFVTTRFITQAFWWDTALLLLTSAIAAVASFAINRFVIFGGQNQA